MNTLHRITVVALIFLLSGCIKNKVILVDNEFDQFVENFKEEASLRSKDIEDELGAISIIFDDIEDPYVSGTCRTSDKVIIIDKFSWSRLNFEEKEHLIFHELGHCVLKRYDHKELESESGDCYSFMRSSSNACSINYYSELWRAYYLDELFNEQEELPNWYEGEEDYTGIVNSFKTEIQVLDTLVRELTLDSIKLDLLDRHFVEFEFSNWKTEENLVQLRFGNIIFSSCNMCQVSKLNISKRNESGVRYYSNSAISFVGNMKLSIYIKENLAHFYVNETYIHSMESSLVNGKFLETNRFDDYLRVSGKILYN